MATTRKVIIIGSGPAGYTAAIYGARANLAPLMLSGVQAGGQLMLTTLVENYPGFVDVVHRRDALRGSKIMQERAFKNPKIEFIWDTAVDDILDVDKGKVTTVRLKNVKTQALHERPVDGLFVAIGHEPNTQIFRGQI